MAHKNTKLDYAVGAITGAFIGSVVNEMRTDKSQAKDKSGLVMIPLVGASTAIWLMSRK